MSRSTKEEIWNDGTGRYMKERLGLLWHNDGAQDVAEYALLLSLVLVVIIVSVRVLGIHTDLIFTLASHALK
jgi:Flp pilus assembly pilin Flp